MIEHKGYKAVMEIDPESKLIFGQVVGLRDLIAFEARTVEEAIDAFRAAVDAYLDDHAREGVEPERPYSGKFHVRIAPDLHRDLAALAESRGVELNDLVAEALAAAVGRAPAAAKLPPPTWQEVKADIEARRASLAAVVGGQETSRGK